ncbi:peroxisomal membrane protein PMP47A [Aureobasidium pullulans]|nr:peroxisomal membrane protein PMP47A [Aureobasidium pullulans]
MSQSVAVKDELQKSTATAPPDAVSQQSDNVAHALAGSGGGLISMALTYPLITLSTRAQVESKKADTNVLQAAQKIIAREGVRGLYAGLESALFGISVTNFVYYYWYEWTRAAFIKAAKAANRPNATKLSTVESMLAGALAGSATVLLTNPIWVVNTRMTARKNESDDSALPTEEAGVKPKKKLSPSTIGTLLSIIKDEGFMRLFAGVLPALVLVINPILQYTIFEQLKQSLEKRRRVTPKDSFYLGALGKLAATSITYPYITVKSRAHVASGQKEGMFDSFSRILREEGWAGLYGGIGPKVTQSVITAAFLFAFKDALYNATVKARRSIAQKAPRRTGPTNQESNDEKQPEKNEKSRIGVHDHVSRNFRKVD